MIDAGGAARRLVPTIEIAGRPGGDVLAAGRGQLDELLPEYLQSQRWFSGKGADLESARIGDVVPIPSPHDPARSVGDLAMIDVRYADGRAPERYATALRTYQAGVEHPQLLAGAELATVRAADGEHVLADAITDPELVEGLVHAMRQGRELGGRGAKLAGQGAQPLENAVAGFGAIDVKPLSTHTSNTSVTVDARDGRQYMLKLVRRHDAEVKPGTPTRALDVWKGAYLTNEAGFANTPAVFGSMEHVGRDGFPRTVSVLTGFRRNDGDGWADALGRARSSLALAGEGADPGTIQHSLDEYATAARNHGRRLGEMHVAFSSGPEGSAFRGVLQDPGSVARGAGKLRADAARATAQLQAAGRPGEAARITAGLQARIDEVARATDELVPIEDIHTHGDFHLGQLLRTGDDVQIVDLEGAPALPMAERWLPAPALDDVARQRSSYEYAASQAVRDAIDADPAMEPQLRKVADRWAASAKDSFLTGWLDATAGHRFRHARSELGPELREAEIRNALYETSYELGSRPEWVDIPLGRVQRLLGADAARPR